MPSNKRPPILLPCWQELMLRLNVDSLRDVQREILRRAGFPTCVFLFFFPVLFFNLSLRLFLLRSRAMLTILRLSLSFSVCMHLE
jgi:hypothetical protein